MDDFIQNQNINQNGYSVPPNTGVYNNLEYGSQNMHGYYDSAAYSPPPQDYYSNGDVYGYVQKKTAYICSVISFVCGISVVVSLLLYIIYIIMELSSLHVPDSLMLSVFGWLLAIVTFVCPIPSLVFGIIGLVKSRQKTIEYNANKARLFSIIGIVSFGICLIMFLIIVVLAFIGLNAVYSSYV